MTDGERYWRLDSLVGERRKRILGLATRIAETGNTWPVYDQSKHIFGIREGYQSSDEAKWDTKAGFATMWREDCES